MDKFNIEQITQSDQTLISDFMIRSWGSPYSVSRGKMHDVVNLPGFICKQNGKIAGLVTYHIENNECEIVTLDSIIENKGLGSRLVEKVIQTAKENQCDRVWLITTNDNCHAIRYYQKRGFDWVGFYRDAMDESRKLKPEIPNLGEDGIPIRHEIEFQYKLHS
jgi:ribosomal protein S18 acetylase RimI-like enzyme